MPLHIYNSLTRQKQEFKPIEANKVKFYACGVTVYDYSHIGHARSYIVFDVIVRYLRDSGYAVTYVRNITDIDDKIIKRAAENGETCDELTERFIRAFHEDEKALGITAPDAEPRATDFIAPIVQLIQTLLDKDQAYVADNGDVCFAVHKFKDYGKLSQRKLEDLIAGARVEIATGKRDPLDFVLWKLAKPGEPHWSSPWGEGRPGWHIECSAMSTGLLGQPFDIHAGGMDLKFPHHENEIAQSEAACGKPFANLWMHAGLLQVNNEKMSKSLGNFFTIREVLEKYSAEEVRYFMLSCHYRSPVNYSDENLAQVHQSLISLYTALRNLPDAEPTADEYQKKFIAVMDDDFNTPEAFAILFELAREINRLKEQNKINEAAGFAATLKKSAAIFGILQQDPEIFLQGDSDTAKIELLIAERNSARANKNWQAADVIRQQLIDLGIAIEDGAGKTTWRKL